MLCHTNFIQEVHQVPQRLVHPFDKGGESLGGLAFIIGLVMGDEAWIDLKGIVYRIVRHVQVEGLSGFHGFPNLFLGLQGKCLREVGGCPMIGLQVRDGSWAVPFDPAIPMFPEITTRLSNG